MRLLQLFEMQAIDDFFRDADEIFSPGMA